MIEDNEQLQKVHYSTFHTYKFIGMSLRTASKANRI